MNMYVANTLRAWALTLGLAVLPLSAPVMGEIDASSVDSSYDVDGTVVTADGQVTTAYQLDAAKADRKHVLVLNSYAPGYKWVDEEVRGIKEVLLRHPHLVVRVEYQDTKMINTQEHFRLLRDLYANKYADYRFDVILATDDDALTFLREYGEELFPGVPVVFCGINYFTESKVEGLSQVTGVNEESDFRETLDLILRLHPRTKTVYVVNDPLTTGKFLHRAFEADSVGFEAKVRFEYIDDVDLDQLKQRLGGLPPDSVVFYLSFFQDSEGRTYTPEEVIPAAAAVSPAPIYGTVDYMLGLGIVGGKLRSGYYQGITAARLAERVLAGEKASTIPIVMDSPNHYMFDYRLLSRFGIDLDDLPDDSTVINEPETFYYRYKNLIWSVLAAFCALVVYIVVLLFNIRKRIRAQNGLRTIIGAATSLFDLQSMEGFKTPLLSFLKSLMPVSSPPQFFRPAPPSAEGHTEFVPVAAGPADSVSREIPESVKALLDRSLKENRSVIDKKAGVAYFASKALPGNLVYLKANGSFDDLDRDLLEIFTANVSMAVESLEKHKLEEALETARKIQMSMLPRDFAAFSERFGVDLHAFLAPAKEVGGDLYDFFSIDEDHLCFTVGDVSDKGIPAALFMVMAKTLMRSASESNRNPDEILVKVNNLLSRDNDQSMFVTQFLAILDRRSGELTYANAGHNPPYIVGADGQVRSIHPKAGMVLGAFPGMTYERETCRLEEGDALVIYSDGVTEAMNEAHQMFMEERLERSLAANASESSEEIVGRLIRELKGFTRTAPQSDDITVLVVRNGEGRKV